MPQGKITQEYIETGVVIIKANPFKTIPDELESRVNKVQIYKFLVYVLEQNVQPIKIKFVKIIKILVYITYSINCEVKHNTNKELK